MGCFLVFSHQNGILKANECILNVFLFFSFHSFGRNGFEYIEECVCVLILMCDLTLSFPSLCKLDGGNIKKRNYKITWNEQRETYACILYIRLFLSASERRRKTIFWYTFIGIREQITKQNSLFFFLFYLRQIAYNTEYRIAFNLNLRAMRVRFNGFLYLWTLSQRIERDRRKKMLKTDSWAKKKMFLQWMENREKKMEFYLLWFRVCMKHNIMWHTNQSAVALADFFLTILYVRCFIVVHH